MGVNWELCSGQAEFEVCTEAPMGGVSKECGVCMEPQEEVRAGDRGLVNSTEVNSTGVYLVSFF